MTIEEGHPEDIGCGDALEALGREAGVDTMSCNECPFPFCVAAESRKLRNFARDMSITAMRSMHASVALIAARLGISTYTVYQVTKKRDVAMGDCYWCKLNLKEGGVFCRPSYCTVAFDNKEVALSLSSHRKATHQEVSIIETLVGNMFPDGVITNVNDCSHDHWIVNRVNKGEASAVYDHMTALSAFTTGLR